MKPCYGSVCVCPICKDVKLRHVNFVYAGGQEPMTVCPGQRRPDSMGVKTYLRFFELLIKLLHCVVSNLHGCHNLYFLHQNLPQYFRRDHVADCIFDYLDYFADYVADVFGIFC